MVEVELSLELEGFLAACFIAASDLAFHRAFFALFSFPFSASFWRAAINAFISLPFHENVRAEWLGGVLETVHLATLLARFMGRSGICQAASRRNPFTQSGSAPLASDPAGSLPSAAIIGAVA